MFKMKSTVILFLTASILILGCAKGDRRSSSSGVSVTDDLGREITFDKPPQRIISLAPSITEILYVLDSAKTLAALTHNCDYPPATKFKPSIGDMVHPNFELIAELKPDLILLTVEGNSKEDFTKIEELGYKTFVTNPRTVEGVYKSITDIGTILGLKARADSIVREMEKHREAIREQVRDVERKRVLVIVSAQPLMTAGPGTFIDQMIQEAGGINIAAEAAVSYPLLSREEVVRKQPEVLIVPHSVAIRPSAIIEQYPEWKELPAAKNRKVIIFHSDFIMRPGPRIILGLEMLAMALHPERLEVPRAI